VEPLPLAQTGRADVERTLVQVGFQRRLAG
jgi:hypothetical protein